MAANLTLIHSEENAQTIAAQWAFDHDEDHSRARAYAHEWFLTTPPELRTVFHLEFMLKAFEKSRANYEAQLTGTLNTVINLAVAWELELVKHLAAFNGAGLAGTAALVAATKYSQSTSIKLGLVFFAIGAALAVLNMWLNTQGLSKRIDYLEAIQTTAKSAKTWRELAQRESDSKGLSAGDMHDMAIRIGWTSAVIGVIAAVLIAFALFFFTGESTS